MKKLQVLLYGKPLRDIYPHATKWQVFKYRVRRFIFRAIRFTIGVSIAGGLSYGVYLFGKLSAPPTIKAVEVQVEVERDAPVLARIAKCESGGKHFGKSGQVLMSPNTNGTVDVGMYQINTVWFAEATKLGLDITKEEDNEKMAQWIYANRGTGDWSASAKCWKR